MYLSKVVINFKDLVKNNQILVASFIDDLSITLLHSRYISHPPLRWQFEKV